MKQTEALKLAQQCAKNEIFYSIQQMSRNDWDFNILANKLIPTLSDKELDEVVNELKEETKCDCSQSRVLHSSKRGTGEFIARTDGGLGPCDCKFNYNPVFGAPSPRHSQDAQGVCFIKCEHGETFYFHGCRCSQNYPSKDTTDYKSKLEYEKWKYNQQLKFVSSPTCGKTTKEEINKAIIEAIQPSRPWYGPDNNATDDNSGVPTPEGYVSLKDYVKRQFCGPEIITTNKDNSETIKAVKQIKEEVDRAEEWDISCVGDWLPNLQQMVDKLLVDLEKGKD